MLEVYQIENWNTIATIVHWGSCMVDSFSMETCSGSRYKDLGSPLSWKTEFLSYLGIFHAKTEFPL